MPAKFRHGSLALAGQHRTAAASLGIAGLPARLPSLRFFIHRSRLRRQDTPSRRLVGPSGPTSHRVPLPVAHDLLVYSSRVICQILQSQSLPGRLVTELAEKSINVGAKDANGHE
jgi:hypothetical protein